jgi:hypothetical protein
MFVGKSLTAQHQYYLAKQSIWFFIVPLLQLLQPGPKENKWYETLSFSYSQMSAIPCFGDTGSKVASYQLCAYIWQRNVVKRLCNENAV